MENNAAIGLYYDRAKYYSPTNGNFASFDPLNNIKTIVNAYIFAKNDPIDKKNLSGNMYFDVNFGNWVGWFPLGGGLQTGPNSCGHWKINPYLDLHRPGWGFTVAPEQSPTPGLNAGLGYGVGPFVIYGGTAWGFDGSIINPFWEYGIGSDGFSSGAWLVSPDINPFNNGCEGNLFTGLGNVANDVSDWLDQIYTGIYGTYGI